MQKREGIRVEVKVINDPKWKTPAPRECATINQCDFKNYLFGGLNYNAMNDVTEAQVHRDEIRWTPIEYKSDDKIKGRQCHSTVAYQNKLYIFGGCFMFNAKRKVRECTN